MKNNSVKIFFAAAVLSAVFSLGCKHGSNTGGTGDIEKKSKETEKYEVTFKQPLNGKLIAEVDGKPFTGDKVEKNKTVYFFAEPAPCFLVNTWKGVEKNQDNFKKAKLTVTSNKIVSVEFKEIPDIKAVVLPGATVTVGYGEPSEGKWKIYDKGVEIKTDFTVNPYAIGTAETSYKLWKEVFTWAETNGYFFEHIGQKGGANEADYKAANHDELEPVTRISWRDAIVWCNAYTEKTMGIDECVYCGVDGKPLKDSGVKIEFLIDAENMHGKQGFRLPTDAEWEFAARGGNPSLPDWKYQYSTGDNIDALVWYRLNADERTHKPKEGNKPPNRLGLYNMCGNVWEYIGSQYKASIKVPRPVMRGGSWYEYETHIGVDKRVMIINIDEEHGAYGFRVCCGIK